MSYLILKRFDFEKLFIIHGFMFILEHGSKKWRRSREKYSTFKNKWIFFQILRRFSYVQTSHV